MSRATASIDQAKGWNEAELSERIVRSFLGRARRLPPKPRDFDRTTVIVRKDIVPFYHAIYDHARGRFVELQVPRPDGHGLLIVALPPDKQPPVLGGIPLE